VVIMPGTSSWQLRDGEQIIACNTSLLGHKHFLIGITRVRNEALILRDTLEYVGKHVDAIFDHFIGVAEQRLRNCKAEHPAIYACPSGPRPLRQQAQLPPDQAVNCAT
jgi:hypothetical protein